MNLLLIKPRNAELPLGANDPLEVIEANDTLPSSFDPFMAGHFLAGVTNPDPLATNRHAHSAPNEAPGHTISVALQFDASIVMNTADQFPQLEERRFTLQILQGLGFLSMESIDGTFPRGAMDPLIPHLSHPSG